MGDGNVGVASTAVGQANAASSWETLGFYAVIVIIVVAAASYWWKNRK